MLNPQLLPESWKLVKDRPLEHLPGQEQGQRRRSTEWDAVQELVQNPDDVLQVGVVDLKLLTRHDGPEGVDNGYVHCAKQVEGFTWVGQSCDWELTGSNKSNFVIILAVTC